MDSISGRGSDGVFVLHHHVETSSGTHPVSYPVGTRVPYHMGKVAGV